MNEISFLPLRISMSNREKDICLISRSLKIRTQDVEKKKVKTKVRTSIKMMSTNFVKESCGLCICHNPLNYIRLRLQKL